ncbi:MAG: hypothetical protein KatS3mg030_535 [Saprospiraceae bacterium]|nr:MAG: hypothetical protein KatS3mg030_535 [Saprospiraceae bacterium]
MLGLRLDLPVRRPNGKVELHAQPACLFVNRQVCRQAGRLCYRELPVRVSRMSAPGGGRGPACRQTGSFSERPKAGLLLQNGQPVRRTDGQAGADRDKRNGKQNGAWPAEGRLPVVRQGAIAEPESTRPRAALPAELANAGRRRGGRPKNYRLAG